MIRLNGVARKEFQFAADSSTTMQYFSDLSQMVQHLPHIFLLEQYSANVMRVCYSSLELGAYSIKIITDLECLMDAANRSITIRPSKVMTPVKGEAGLNSSIGYGYFTSVAYLENCGEGTSIDFRLKMAANLPRPYGLRMMPGRVVNRIASGISQGRVNEIVEGFIVNAVDSFPAWRAKQDLYS